MDQMDETLKPINLEGEKVNEKPEEVGKAKPKKGKRDKFQKEKERQELMIRMKKSDLDKEIKGSIKASKELKRKWKDIALKTGGADVKDLIIEKWNCFEEAMDKKDWLISELLNQWDERVALSQMEFSSHVHQVDNILKDFRNEIDEMKENYNDVRDSYLKNWQEEINIRTEQDKKTEDYMNTIIFTMNSNFREAALHASGQQYSKCREENNKGFEFTERLSSTLENWLLNIWNTYKSVLNEYSQQTEKRRQQIAKLRRKDSTNIIIMNEQGKKLFDLTRRVEVCTRKIKSGEWSQTLENLREERQSLAEVLRTTRIRLQQCQSQGDEALRTLVIASNDTIDAFTCVVEKGEKILKMDKMCSSYETKAEAANVHLLQKQHGFELGFTNTYLDKMISFRQKIGFVEMKQKMLTHERTALRKKNSDLEHKLKKYLGIQPNSLLKVRSSKIKKS